MARATLPPQLTSSTGHFILDLHIFMLKLHLTSDISRVKFSWWRIWIVKESIWTEN